MRKRVIYIDIIHIKRVLRQLQLTKSQHLSPVDHGMHENILVQMEASDIIPAEHLILRKYIAVMNDFFMRHPNFLIHIIRNQHVYFRICIHKSLHCTQYLQQSLFIYPVITVHYFKIDTCGMRQTCIDRIPVTAVFLVYRFDDPRIFFLVFFCNLACPV